MPSSSFNPLEPEDPIYNPRTFKESIYPELNVSNTTASKILNAIGIWKHDEPFPYEGLIENKKLDDLCKYIQKHIQNHNDTVKFIDSDGFIVKLQRLDRVLRFAIALNDDVVWC
jgi:hypothetical protein